MRARQRVADWVARMYYRFRWLFAKAFIGAFVLVYFL